MSSLRFICSVLRGSWFLGFLDHLRNDLLITLPSSYSQIVNIVGVIQIISVEGKAACSFLGRRLRGAAIYLPARDFSGQCIESFEL